MKTRGFTLIELMIVVVIIGILASIAIPKFSTIKEQANEASCRCNLRSLGSAEALYFAKFSSFGSLNNLTRTQTMENSHLLECPLANMRYTVNLVDDTYNIPCPNADPFHGSIDDGLTSW